MHFCRVGVWASGGGVWIASARAQVGKHSCWKLAVSLGLLRVFIPSPPDGNSRSRRNRVEPQRDGRDLTDNTASSAADRTITNGLDIDI